MDLAKLLFGKNSGNWHQEGNFCKICFLIYREIARIKIYQVLILALEKSAPPAPGPDLCLKST